MYLGRPLAPLPLSPAEREETSGLARSRTMPQSLTTRARLVLLAADGATNTEIAERLGLTMPRIGIWRKRYRTQRLAGL